MIGIPGRCGGPQWDNLYSECLPEPGLHRSSAKGRLYYEYTDRSPAGILHRQRVKVDYREIPEDLLETVTPSVASTTWTNEVEMAQEIIGIRAGSDETLTRLYDNTTPVSTPQSHIQDTAASRIYLDTRATVRSGTNRTCNESMLYFNLPFLRALFLANAKSAGP